MPVFLFTDIEGSTRLWEEHTAEMGAVIARHDALLQQRITASGGRITKHTGDGITAVFEAGEPLACALQIQTCFAHEAWGVIGELRIRVGLHAGAAEWIAGVEGQAGDFFGPPVNCAARIMSAAWGGQTLLTPEVSHASRLPARASLKDLGLHLLKDVGSPQQIYQLVHPDLPRQAFPPPRTLSGQSIRQAVKQQGAQMAHLASSEMAVALVSVTLLPTVLGDLPPGSPALAGNMGVLRDLGAARLAEFLGGFVAHLQAAGPEEIRQQLEVALQQRWAADAVLRSDASRLLQAVQGVDATLAAATGEVREALARGLAGLASQFNEFRWVLSDVQETLAEVRGLQRQQLDLQQLQLARTEELLALHREPGRPSLAAAAEVPAVEPRMPAFVEEEAPDLVHRPVFVAREQELAWLEDRLNAALAGQGGVVFVTGGPGRGKTALLQAFARQGMDEHGELLVASGTCNAYSGVGDPYLPFREVLGMLSGDVEAHWAAGAISRDHTLRLWQALPAAVEALLARGPHVVPALVPGEALLARASAAGPVGPWLAWLQERVARGPAAAEGLEQSHLFQQVSNTLRALAEAHPLLLILDDLQWVDRTSAGLLFHLGRRLEGARILIIGAYRPEELALDLEERPGGVGGRHPLEKVLAEFKRLYGDVWLDLAEVDAPEGRRFVDALLATEPNRLGEGFRQTLVERAQGHPLFTVELLRAMQERGDLVQDEAGRWVEGPALDWDVLPVRVEGVIEERIGRLEDELREILTVASVEGEEFTAQVVARVQRISERHTLHQLTAELERRHRLVRAHGDTQVGAHDLSHYRFAHELFRDYLYASISAGERRLLHREVGTVLEMLYEGHTDEIATRLVHHFAGDLDQERHYARIAGDRAAAQYANEEAIKYYSRALALVPDRDVAARCALLVDRERILHLLGNRKAQSQDLDMLASLTEGLDDPEMLAEVALRKATYFDAIGDYPEAIMAAQQAVALAREAGHKEHLVRGHLLWGQALRRQGHADLGRDRWAEARDLASAADLADLAAKSLAALALFEYDRAEYSAAQSFLEQGLAIIRESGDVQARSDMLNTLGTVTEAMGDYAAAYAAFQQALANYQRVGNRLGEGYVRNNLGQVANKLGAYQEAREDYERSLAIFYEIGNRLGQGAVLNNLGETAHDQGDYDGARDYYEQALATFREIGNRPFEGYALTGLGDALAGLGELDKAATAYQQAFALRQQLGQHDRAVTCRVGLMEVRLAQGDLAKAQGHVTSILEHLHAGGSLEKPFGLYLTCYLVLTASQDPRAGEILEVAYHLLLEQAAKIPDERMRRSFLENVTENREIVRLAREANLQA